MVMDTYPDQVVIIKEESSGNEEEEDELQEEDLAKTPIQGKVNTTNGTSMPMVRNGMMNVEAIPMQGKSSKGVLTIKVAK